MVQQENMMVDEHVRLVRQLGSGGMGTLWVGYDDRLDREVAVKFITPDVLERNPGLKERFKREAVAAARIRSPYVVQIHAHGEQSDGTPYMVMELLDGESLGERLEKGKRLSIEDCAQVLAQVGKALAAAHKLGVIHRDIKPDNIFLLRDEDVFVKLLDFGIAKHSQLPESATNLTATGSVLGTPHYMSPEQLLNTKGVDHRADLWALGVVGYVMVTGELPFVGETLAATIVAITNINYAPPSTKGAPPAFDDWFARVFHRDIEQRFSSAKEMADAFAAACRRQAQIAVPPPTATRPEQPYVAPTPAPATERVEAIPYGSEPSGSQEPARTVPSQPPGPLDPRLVTPPQGGMPVTASGQRGATISTPPPQLQGAYPGSVPTAQPVPQTFAGSTATLTGEKKPSASKVIAILLAAAVAGGGAVAGVLYFKKGKRRAKAPSAASVERSATPASSSEPAKPLPPPPEGMVAVPAGKYMMGCDASTSGCFGDEQPQHEVSLDAYAIMEHEVKMGDYDLCVGDGKCPDAGTEEQCTWQREGHERHPINCVTLEAAKAYCAYKGWRLPTEAEWEAAARPPDGGGRYPWGDDPPSCEITVMKASKPGCGSGEAVSIGSRDEDRSHVGAFDMGGNVREWTSTTYGAYPGGKADADRAGTVNRGGSYLMNGKSFASVFTRGVDSPDEARPGLGFRCAADLK